MAGCAISSTAGSGSVREALTEREVLLRMAPHLIRPLRFVLPQEPGSGRPGCCALGLFLYDHLGGRKMLPATRTIDLSRDPLGAPLKGRYRTGFEYSDCQTDDARLVVLNALDAAERGAVIRTRTRCVRAERGDVWRLILKANGQREAVTARVLINATGPWLGSFGESALRQPPATHLRLDKGSHIVVRRLFDHDRAYIFQAADGRIVFALPFERDFTLIGTTDRKFTGDPAAVAPDGEDINYLCTVVNDYFRTPIGAADTVWAFAGVRALYDDGAQAAGHAARLCAHARRALGRGAAAHGLWRQDHDLSAPRRGRAGAAVPLFPRRAGHGPKSHPCPAAISFTTASRLLVEQTRRNWPFLERGPRATAHARLTAPGSTASSGRPRRRATSD